MVGLLREGFDLINQFSDRGGDTLVRRVQPVKLGGRQKKKRLRLLGCRYYILSWCNPCVVLGDFSTASTFALCSGLHGVLVVAVRRLKDFLVLNTVPWRKGEDFVLFKVA